MRTEYLFPELLSRYFVPDRALREKKKEKDATRTVAQVTVGEGEKKTERTSLINGSGTFNSRIAEVRIKGIV